MKLLLVLIGLAGAIDHIMSFNAHCNATFELFAGTPMQTGFTAGRVPFQFVNALQRVMKDRVSKALPACAPFGGDDGAAWPKTSAYAELFGLDTINVVRFLDASDTVIMNALNKYPPGCSNETFAFSWSNLRSSFKGVNLPDTCRASTFYNEQNGKPLGCKLKFEVLDEFNIEFSLNDACKNPLENGWRLPQIELRCSGAKCATLGRPCTANADCSGGLTCDPVGLWLNDTEGVLEEIGLYGPTDSCDIGEFNFTEQVFSQVVNNVANLLGFTPTVENKMWHEVSLCGVAEIKTQWVKTQAPTPAETPMFKCGNGTWIPVSNVCDGVPDCDPNVNNADDEGFGFDCTCGTGMLRYNGYCCYVCGDETDDCNAIWTRGYPSCSVPPPTDTTPDFIQIDEATNTVTLTNLFPSTGASGTVPAIPFKAVSSNGDQHVAVWADCSGSVQIGNPEDLAVFNGFVPFHQIAARLEGIIKSTQSCRNNADVSEDYLKRQFFIYGVGVLGGMFMDTLSATTSFGGRTPGALFDDSARWYDSADERNSTGHHIKSPPFENLYTGPWTTCTKDTVTGPSKSCDINAVITDWFQGAGFPESWGTVPSTVQVRVASDCNVPLGQAFQGDSFPNVFGVCQGVCTPGAPSDADSGCCLMRKPFVVLGQNQLCPPGYVRSTIESNLTDFLFEHDHPQSTRDTTLINFLQLLSVRKFDFDASVEFLQTDQNAHSICVVNTTGFDDNVEAWGEGVATENCPAPMTTPNGSRGCPQILPNGGLQSCGPAPLVPCMTTPTGSNCPETGCPVTPPEIPCVLGLCGTSGAWVVAPSVMLVSALFLW